MVLCMTAVEPYTGDGSPESSKMTTAHDKTTRFGHFIDAQMEALYRTFRAQYKSHGLIIYIVQYACLNVAGIVQTSLYYRSQFLPHLILMSCFLVINILFVIFLPSFTINYIFASIAVCSYGYLQLYIDATLSAYITSLTTSLPWLIVTSYATYSALPVPLVLCAVISCLGLLGHTLLMTLLPAAHAYEDMLEIPHMIGANILLLACANLLGVASYMRADRTLRKAFLETKESLSVSFIIEESSKEQERLLLSVLPKHVAHEMVKDWGTQVTGQFRKIYMSRHENVSILFADIVGFTAMSSLVTPAELVQILNDLFATFDKLSEKYHQLRIKILGDCYYCICGCPQPRSDHAVLCIHMGLAMVDAITEVRENTKSGVNMRVGIHTGAVLAGVLGQQRWQYDVLGKEVTLANKMESGGLPGRVHISESTASFLSGEFELEPGEGDTREEAIKMAAIKTFLIKSVIKPHPQGTLDEQRMTSPSDKVNQSENSFSFKGDKSTKLDEEILKSNKLMNLQGKVNKVTLKFADKELEQMYSGSLGDNVAVALLAPPFVLTMNFCAQLCVLPINYTSIATFVIAVVITGLLALLSMALYFPKKFPEFIRKLACHISATSIGRSLYFIFSAIFLGAADIVDVHACEKTPIVRNITSLHSNSPSCDYPSYFSIMSVLVLLAIYFQSQLSCLLRSLLMVGFITLVCAFYNTTAEAAFQRADSVFGKISSSNIVFTISLIAVCIFLVIYSRYSERQSRSLFVYRRYLDEKHSQIDVLREKNKALVYNILPAHVAMHFISNKKQDEELYSQQYSEVGVMFAACPNFNDHYTEDAINNHGVEWMRFLNEVISDYDDLLSDSRFSNIVKIKTIGPTYMASSGLNMAAPIPDDAQVTVRWRHLADLVEFALALQETLDRINSQSFNNFMLRIGINHGPILAGVIGARKPHYDIWGNSVNVASRMESTGQLGHIQVVEETMLILQEFGYTFKQRGYVKVKGKGNLMTYFLTGKEAIT